MLDINRIIEDLLSKWGILDDGYPDMCECSCGWHGLMEGCDYEMEGWPPSTLYHCPKCDDGEVNTFYYSYGLMFAMVVYHLVVPIAKTKGQRQ